MTTTEAPFYVETDRPPTDVEVRVGRGIALLEEKLGPDWAASIDLAKLNLLSSIDCVLGQVFGDYQAGTYELGLKPGLRSEEHGFTYRRSVSGDWDALDRTWRKVLTPRVNEPTNEGER